MNGFNKLEFVTVTHYHPYLILAGMARILPFEWSPVVGFTQLAKGGSDKHCSLLNKRFIVSVPVLRERRREKKAAEWGLAKF
jgi:hypothetical protein